MEIYGGTNLLVIFSVERDGQLGEKRRIRSWRVNELNGSCVKGLSSELMILWTTQWIFSRKNYRRERLFRYVSCFCFVLNVWCFMLSPFVREFSLSSMFRVPWWRRLLESIFIVSHTHAMYSVHSTFSLLSRYFQQFQHSQRFLAKHRTDILKITHKYLGWLQKIKIFKQKLLGDS